MRDALVVESPVGPRWELALLVLRDGGGRVRYGRVELGRSVEGPEADGKVHVAVDALSAGLGHAGADRAVADGLAQLEALKVASPDLARLLIEFGTTIEYVFDHGDGAVVLGVIAGEQLRWVGN